MKLITNKVNTSYMEFFLLEKKMNLFSLQYNKVNYWQLVRFLLLKKITIKDLYFAENCIKRNYIKEMISTFSKAWKADIQFKKIKNVDIVRIRPCVTLTNNGKLDDHQYDYIDLKSKYRVLDLYALGDYVTLPECVEYNMAKAEARLILWKIKRKIFGCKSLEKKQHIILKNFLGQINKIYGTKFDIDSLEKNIQYSVHCHMIYCNYYLKIFSQLKPKIIMEYPHYDEHIFAANAAAKKLDIKTIELQHGRINAHEAYWYEDQKRDGKLLPDYFGVYGKWWAEQIKLPQFSKPIVIGNPYLEKQMLMYPKKTNISSKTLAVFSSHQNGKVLSDFIYSLNDYFYQNEIAILYKLHPNEQKIWNREYPNLIKIKNIKIIDDNTSIYSVLSKSDYAIGVNSTVFYEALAYKEIQLFIYTMGNYEAMKPLIENKMARPIKDKKELIECLNTPNPVSKDDLIKDELWESNASLRTNKIIDELINLEI